jgi:hypothetical protein
MAANSFPQIRPCCRKAGRKEKTAILNWFIRTIGYNQKYAPRIPGKPETVEPLRVIKGKAVKLRPLKKRPANRTGKKSIPMMSLRLRVSFGITPEIRKKLMRISPATIDRALKKDKEALKIKGKSLTKPCAPLKHRIPIRTFYPSEERKLPGFIQTGTVHHCGQAAFGRPHFDRHRCRFRLDIPVFPA